MFMRTGAAACAALALFPNLEAAGQDVPAAIGWRGNLTGLFPDASVPTERLAIGPFAVKDGTVDFAKGLTAGEANLAPQAGEKLGELEWKTPHAVGDGVTFAGVNTTIYYKRQSRGK
jgi:hypothetical protein